MYKKKGFIMTDFQWKVFCEFREELKNQIKKWSEMIPNLQELQKNAAEYFKIPEYSFETPIVYNSDLDNFTKDDEIKLIVIGDNPGKDEQLKKNQKYLVGQAGKIAEGFFRRNPELNIDFRKNVIILNKTPIHSAKTVQLKFIVKNGGKKVESLLLESQLWMAEKTAKLHSLLNKDSHTELWIVGYSELKEKRIFVPYKNKLLENYKENFKKDWKDVFVFQHFSMNRFTIDLQNFRNEHSEEKNLLENIHTIGKNHKEEIFGNIMNDFF